MEDHDIDPGGSTFDLDCDRLALANSSHNWNLTRHTDHMESIGKDLAACKLNSKAKSPSSKNEASFDDTISATSDYGSRIEDFSSTSMNDPTTIPNAEQTIDDMPLSYIQASGISSDLGYASISASDFSSLGSFSLDSGLSLANPQDTISTNAMPQNESPKTKLRNRAHKMRFTDAEIKQSFSELGDIGDDFDKLLNHLVKARSARAPPAAKGSTSVTKSSSKTSQAPLNTEGDSKGLRRIVIDGSNVAMEHGHHQIYSCKGIEIVVRYFQQRGHEHITVFVPAHRLRKEGLQTKDQHILNDLARQGVVVKTPSRRSSKGHIASYEDRFILKLASMEKAIVVSNDQFRDLKSERTSFRETIEKRILPFAIVADQFIPAEDPLGKRGPTLEQFLRVVPYNSASGACPYGRKCTYGTKCKFGHPERDDSYDSALGSSYKGPPSTASQHSDQWGQSRAMTFEQYNMGVANNLVPHHGVNYSPFFQPRGAPQQRLASPYPPYMPQEYPPLRAQLQPPALRACLHDKSYHSLPHDDMPYQSRQPGNPDTTSSSDVLSSSISSQLTDGTSPLATRWSDPVSSISSTVSSDLTSTPQPLNECYYSDLTQYSKQSTRPLEGRHPPQPDDHSHHCDGRCKIYFHLTGLFPEKVVRQAMKRHPNETDPNKLTATVLEMQSQRKVVNC